MRVNKPHNKAILITIDCLRADHLKCYGYKRKTSPFLDYLAIKGVKFENAFANGPNTPSSFRSIFASGYPFEFIRPEPFAPNTVLLPEILANNGVRTAAIHSNPHLSAFYKYNRGWNYFQDFQPTNIYKRNNLRHLGKIFQRQIQNWFKPFETAESVTETAISWLKKNIKCPFFLWLHYMDLHEPYFLVQYKMKRIFSKKISIFSQIMCNRAWKRALKRKSFESLSIEDIGI